MLSAERRVEKRKEKKRLEKIETLTDTQVPRVTEGVKLGEIRKRERKEREIKRGKKLTLELKSETVIGEDTKRNRFDNRPT